MEKQVSPESFISANSLSFVLTNKMIQRDISIVDNEFKEDLNVLEFQLWKTNLLKEIVIARDQLCLIPKWYINGMMAQSKPPQIIPYLMFFSKTTNIFPNSWGDNTTVII